MRRPRNNRAYFNADRRILQATGKILKLKRTVSIKVCEISRVAGLAKSSFYIHYRSLSDLIEQNEQKILDNIDKEVTKILKDKDRTLEKSYRNVLLIFRQHKDFLGVAIRSNNVEMLIKVMKILKPVVTENWNDYGRKTNDAIFRQFSANAIVEISLWKSERFAVDEISKHARNLSALTRAAPKNFTSIYYR